MSQEKIENKEELKAPGDTITVKHIYAKHNEDWIRYMGSSSGPGTAERIKRGYLTDDGELIIELWPV